MSLMPTAPRSIGGVLDDAIRLYRRALVPCMPIVLVAVIVLAVPSLWLALRMQDLASANPRAALAFFKSPVIVLSYLGMAVFMCVNYGALLAQANAVARGDRLSLGAALGIGLRRAPVALGVSILFGLMIAVGCVLLLIPGIWLWGVFQFAFVSATVERNGVFKSLGTSARLVKGNWWRANTIMFVAVVIMMVLGLVVGMISGLATAFSGGAVGSGGGITGALLVQQLMSSLLSLFTMSFVPCVFMAVYNDLKLRSEGADLADRVGALKPAS
jgi:hypothetical protein